MVDPKSGSGLKNRIRVLINCSFFDDGVYFSLIRGDLKSPLERGKVSDNSEADWQEQGVCTQGQLALIKL